MGRSQPSVNWFHDFCSAPPNATNNIRTHEWKNIRGRKFNFFVFVKIQKIYWSGWSLSILPWGLGKNITRTSDQKIKKFFFFAMWNYFFFELLKSWVHTTNTEKVLSKKLSRFFRTFQSSGTTLVPNLGNLWRKSRKFPDCSKISNLWQARKHFSTERISKNLDSTKSYGSERFISAL